MTRLRELDAIRGIAIFLVLLYHFIFGQAVLDSVLAMRLVKFLGLAWSGVDLFFVLSGFLIVGILLDAKLSSSYFSTFYARRALRILPLYFLMLLLFIILPHYISNDSLFVTPLPLWSYFTFTQNFFMITYDFGANWLAVTWSLAVEEQYYLILPFLVWSLPKNRLTFLFLILICMAPIFRLIFDGLGGYIFPLARADSILMGGMLAIAYRTPKVKNAMYEYYRYFLVLFFVFLFGVGILTFSDLGIGDVFVHLWLAVFYSLLLIVCTLRPEGVISVSISNRFFVWLGLRSYGIYLFHIPVSSITHQFLTGHVPHYFSNWPEFLVTLFAMLITFVLAEISFRLFESFFLSYGRKFRYETQPLS
jgi:peptidoglycan/LPS O-acetylase OafA/YrhL